MAQHFILRSQPSHGSNTGRERFLILLIEDSRADAGLVRESLNQYHVAGELVVIPDGDSATRFIESLDAQQTRSPDLVIIDLNLPRVPGLSVLKTMRKSLKCKDATAVVLSSSEIENDRIEALRLGATRYIRKPLRLEEFLSLGAVFKTMLDGMRC